MHAKDWGTYGKLTVTRDISQYTKAKVLHLGAVTKTLFDCQPLPMNVARMIVKEIFVESLPKFIRRRKLGFG